MTLWSMTMACSFSVGWSGGDSSFTHLQVKGRRVGHGIMIHDHALLFLTRVEWSMTHPPPHSPVRRRGVGHDLVVHDHALAFLSSMEWR